MSDTVITTDVFGRLREATANQPAVLVELCRDYLLDARSALEEMRNAIARGDAAQLRERAHYLKGSSMIIGAGALQQYCATLEQMGRNSELRGATTVHESAVAALNAVEAELTRELGPTVLPAEGSAA